MEKDGCRFCDKGADRLDTLQLGRSGLQVWVNDWLIKVLSGCGDYAIIPINYCPICGKQLRPKKLFVDGV